MRRRHLLLGSAATVLINGRRARAQAKTVSLWHIYNNPADMMFGPAPNTPQMMAAKGEARRILAMNTPGQVSDQDTGRLAQLVAGEDGISLPAATSRVTDTEARWAAAAHDARRTATVTALWTAIALLFGMIVAVAASISARWQDDRINFGWKPRR